MGDGFQNAVVKRRYAAIPLPLPRCRGGWHGFRTQPSHQWKSLLAEVSDATLPTSEIMRAGTAHQNARRQIGLCGQTHQSPIRGALFSSLRTRPAKQHDPDQMHKPVSRITFLKKNGHGPSSLGQLQHLAASHSGTGGARTPSAAVFWVLASLSWTDRTAVVAQALGVARQGGGRWV